MRTTAVLLAIGLIVAGVGCQSASPPPRIAVPAETAGNPNVTRERDPVKPMPSGDRSGDISPPFDDMPLVNQRPPEQREFVQAYQRVGKPRITVIVTPDLKPASGEAQPAIDYAAMETTLADWIGSNGQVILISPSLAQQQLSEQQIKDLQSGSTDAARKVAQQMDADVIVHVRVEPTRQSGQPAARLLGESINARGGQSIGRALVDVPPPVETQINKYTRYVARKLMDDMTATWNSMPPPPPAPPPAPASVDTPTPPAAPPAPVIPSTPLPATRPTH